MSTDAYDTEDRYDYVESMFRSNDMYRDDTAATRGDFDGYKSRIGGFWRAYREEYVHDDRLSKQLSTYKPKCNDIKSKFATMSDVTSTGDPIYDKMMSLPFTTQQRPQKIIPTMRNVHEPVCSGSDPVEARKYEYTNLYHDEIRTPNGKVIDYNADSYGDMILKSLSHLERYYTDRETKLFRIGTNKFNDGMFPDNQILSKRNILRKDLSNPHDEDDQLDGALIERNNMVRSTMKLQEAEKGGMQSKCGNAAWLRPWQLTERSGYRNYQRDDDKTHYSREMSGILQKMPISTMLTPRQPIQTPSSTPRTQYGIDSRSRCSVLTRNRCNDRCNTKITLTYDPLPTGPS
jgi:hypothetical protein